MELECGFAALPSPLVRRHLGGGLPTRLLEDPELAPELRALPAPARRQVRLRVGLEDARAERDARRAATSRLPGATSSKRERCWCSRGSWASAGLAGLLPEGRRH